MNEAEKEKTGRKVQRYVFIAAYALAFLVYAFAGALLFEIIFPDWPFLIMFVVSALAAARLDYHFKGPMFKFEKRYVSLKEKE